MTSAYPDSWGSPSCLSPFFPTQDLESSPTGLVAHIVIEGTPRPARIKKGRYGQIYNARDRLITSGKWVVKSQYNAAPFEFPVLVNYYFGMPIPKGWPKSKREAAHNGYIPHVKTPDFDNLKKTYNDIIKGIVIRDDSQIYGGMKWTKSYDISPRVEMWIYDGRRREV